MDALLALWERGRRRLGPRVEDAVDWLKEAARPPEGMVVTTADGTVYTGLAVLERNNIIVLFAVGERGHPASRPTPEPTRTSPEPPRYGRSVSLWEHEHRRRLQEDEQDDDWPR